MQIAGEWFPCDDGVRRPIIRGSAMASDGTWATVPFLVDTGADRTVLSRLVLAALNLAPVPSDEGIGGLGGLVDSVIVETTIRFNRQDGNPVTFRGQFAAVTELEALDMSVLGRDITGLFAVIVDRPGDCVYLLGQRHRYSIITI